MDILLMETILNPAFSISARMAPVLPLRTASGLMMLNVRCDNVFLLGESLLLSVEQGYRTAPVPRAATSLRSLSDDAKDSVDLVRGLRSMAGRRPPEPAHAQHPARPPRHHG